MGSIDAACIAGFLCRLCSEMHRTVIHIYGDQGQKHGLAQKINEYLPVTITPTDPLPKTICETCMTRVEQHHDLMLKMAKTRAHFARLRGQVTLLRNEITETEEMLSSNATSATNTDIATATVTATAAPTTAVTTVVVAGNTNATAASDSQTESELIAREFREINDATTAAAISLFINDTRGEGMNNNSNSSSSSNDSSQTSTQPTMDEEDHSRNIVDNGI